MKGNIFRRKGYFAAAAVLLLAMVLQGGGIFAAERIVLTKYPELKMGFTTQNFLQPLPVSLENAKKLVDWASSQGFSWIEYRDPSAKLTLDECRQLAAYAKGKNLEMSYAAQVGILDPTYWEIFSRGVANAAVFEGPKTFRTLIAGAEFAADPKKTGWNLQELYRLVTRANRAANMAKARGVQYVTENATEMLKGNGTNTFGTTEFLANANSNVGWQMDTANFFAVSRVVAKPEEAQAFLEKNVGRLKYSHIKSSSKEHKSTSVMEENELPFSAILPILTTNKVNYVAIELNQQPKLEDCQTNLMKSIDFLKKNY